MGCAGPVMGQTKFSVVTGGGDEDLAQCATAVVLSHDCRTNTSAYFRCSSMRPSSGNGEPSLS